nr:uncharacterized protein LOC126531966 [Dermacentor andersoni]
MSEVQKKTLSDEATVTFLALVEGFPALWNIEHADYANAQLRNRLWQEIALEVAQRHAESSPYSVEFLKAVFANKRRTFRSEKKKKKTTKSGQSTEEVYAGKWRFYSCLTFLDTVKSDDARLVTEEFVEKQSAPGLATDTTIQDIVHTEETSAFKSPPSPCHEQPVVLSQETAAPGRKRKNADMMLQRTAALKKVADALSKNDTEDSASLFGKLVASYMRQLSPTAILRCQKDAIDAILPYLSET